MLLVSIYNTAIYTFSFKKKLYFVSHFCNIVHTGIDFQIILSIQWTWGKTCLQKGEKNLMFALWSHITRIFSMFITVWAILQKYNK